MWLIFCIFAPYISSTCFYMTDTFPTKTTHHGRNVKRLREMLGMKQESIAFELEITQQAFSEMEKKESIDDKTLERIAKIMHVPVEAIKNMTDDAVHNYINTFYDNSVQYNFNPIEKIVKLYEEKEALYERLLREKDALLARLLSDDRK